MPYKGLIRPLSALQGPYKALRALQGAYGVRGEDSSPESPLKMQGVRGVTGSRGEGCKSLGRGFEDLVSIVLKVFRGALKVLKARERFCL